ncbi:META domain-containing protein [Candidatus Uabimicrobium sp. HlEnr_7]|uniref:META domain-containing protein n=1 Tax=Candidatus Uabimicrobium helgolandensis TaxID=3095367 RepID=UPI003555F090
MYKVIIFVFLCLLCSCQQNEITRKIVEQPYWCLSEATENGNKISINQGTGFTLYSDNNLSGYLPVNGFGGSMKITKNGVVKFVDVSWTSMAGEPKIMKEEMELQKLIFEVNKAQIDGEKLILSNENIVLAYVPCELGYIKNLRKNSWSLVGIEKQEPSDIVSMHTDPKEQYKNLTASKQNITLNCKPGYRYDSSSNSIVYEISGRLGQETYTAELNVSKSTGRMNINKVKSNSQKNSQLAEYLQDLGALSNFSFMHNNLHVDTNNNTLLVFKKEN